MNLERISWLLLSLFFFSFTPPEEEENPAIFQHVNLITGHLQLVMEDTLINGAIPLSVTKAYCSSGALEADEEESDLYLKKLRNGFLIQGGWSLFPQTHMLIRPSRRKEGYVAYVSDKVGSVTVYDVDKKEGQNHVILRPQSRYIKTHGKISCLSNKSLSWIRLNEKEGKATLHLPDGSRHFYRGKHFQARRGEGAYGTTFYSLQKEEHLDGHKVLYEYNKKDRLTAIKCVNREENKVFSSLSIQMHRAESPYSFTLHTSDDKHIHYQFKEIEKRDYLHTTNSSCKPLEFFDYTKDRKGAGARVNNILFDGIQQCRIFYYTPIKKKEAEKIRKHPEKKGCSIDKVERIEAPIGPNGEYVAIAKFTYSENVTDVRDVNNILIRFHHIDGHPTRIEYFDDQEKLNFSTVFLYKDQQMVAKVRLNKQHNPLFSKTFNYDAFGSVTSETFYGNLSGAAQGVFSMQDDGSLSSAESYKKEYSYDPSTHLLIEEKEDDGLCYKYRYLEGTNLLIATYTLYQDKILKRHFITYDSDYLIKEEVIDDGSTFEINDLQDVKERRIKRHERDRENGRIIKSLDLFFDINLCREQLIKESHFSYTSSGKVCQEEVLDAERVHRYTLYSEYDAHGNILCHTSPLGQKNSYEYDRFNRLIFSKEVGNKGRKFFYDVSGNVCREEEIDFLGNTKAKITTYDWKGHPVSQVDFYGQITNQVFDYQGRCIHTSLPVAYDENKTPYHPEVSFDYDTLGNLTAIKDPRGCSTITSYTTLRKPYKIISPDGLVTEHRYALNDTLKETLHPDGSKEYFEYDALKRLTNKKLFSQNGDLLLEESWSFYGMRKHSHTDEMGLTTFYEYDGAGRLIKEFTQQRCKRYQYDSLGFLFSENDSITKHVNIHDVGGRILEAWDEDILGRKENHMSFFYDEENRKISAIRDTSQGVAKDQFFYDSEGRLSLHIDPLMAKTHFTYTRDENNYLVKKTIDPLNVTTEEIFNLQNQPITKTVYDKEGHEVSKEEMGYDQSGNLAKKISYFFREDSLNEPHTVFWHYDRCNRILMQKEPYDRCTHYEYDARGQVSRKTLPSGIIFFYAYDPLGRLLEQKSSKGDIHYKYSYDKGSHPYLIEDLISQEYVEREYTLYGDLTFERSSYGIEYSWHYDDEGRLTQLTLPDNSFISYSYEGFHLKKIERVMHQGHSYCHIFDSYDVCGHLQKEIPVLSSSPISYTYDLLERPQAVTSPWYSFRQSYGPSGLVTRKEDSFFGSSDICYDALNQLQSEGDTFYNFDNLGHPKHALINVSHQLLSMEGVLCDYDVEGRLIQKKSHNGTSAYSYDSLGRLTNYKSAGGQEITLCYDGLSRLISSQTENDRSFYLYDKEREIGKLNSEGEIEQLQILCLERLNKERGAIALEIDQRVYLPINDLQGNIVGILSSDLQVYEKYHMSCFGHPTLSQQSYINPWRFQKKRHIDEDLIYFGLRFYDPSMYRWITKDPLGFADGMNPYQFTANSPICRLDLFGLFAEPRFVPYDVNLEVPLYLITNLTSFKEVQTLRGSIDGVEVDWLIKGGNWSKLEFTDEELSAGKINLINHFNEILPRQGNTLGFISFQNGIQTKLDEAKEMVQSLSSWSGQDTLILSLYSPSKSLLSDFNEASFEIYQHKETQMTALTRQYFAALSTSLFKINPESFWMHIAHSRGGGIAARAAEGMSAEQIEIMKKNLVYIGLGPSVPMSCDLNRSSINLYSNKDLITGRYGKQKLSEENYNILFLHCITPLKDRLFNPLWTDHSFFGETYKQGLRKQASIMIK